MTRVPTEGCEETETQTQVKGRETAEAEMEVMSLQAKDCRQPPGLGGRPEAASPSGPPGGTNPADTLVLDFWPPEL